MKASLIIASLLLFPALPAIAQLTPPPASEKTTEATPPSEMSSSTTLTQWTDRVTIKGDFRFRHDYTQADAPPGNPDEDRHRGRIRARLGLEGKVNDEVSIGFRLATSSGGDRNSFNTDLGANGDKKDVYFDWAFAKWAPSDSYSALIGKFDNPFVTVGGSQLVWDVDYSPEGLALNYANASEVLIYEAHLGTYWMEERNGSGGESTQDSGMLGAQVGATLKTDLGAFSLFAANYYFSNYKGEAAIEAGGGNTEIAGNFTTDFNLVNLGLSYGTELFQNTFEIYADVVQNTATTDRNLGQLVGFHLGQLKEKGDWRLSYNWRKTEANATLAGLNESDFVGGTTDSKGHTLSYFYGLSKGINLGATYFMAEQSADSGGRDYNRLLVDLNLKF